MQYSSPLFSPSLLFTFFLFNFYIYVDVAAAAASFFVDVVFVVVVVAVICFNIGRIFQELPLHQQLMHHTVDIQPVSGSSSRGSLCMHWRRRDMKRSWLGGMVAAAEAAEATTRRRDAELEPI